MSYITDVVFITSMWGDKSKADVDRFQQIWRDYYAERYDRAVEPLETHDSDGPKWASNIVYYVTFNYGPVEDLMDGWQDNTTVLYIDHEAFEEPLVVRGGTE